MPRGRPKKITTEEAKPTEVIAKEQVKPETKNPKPKYFFGLGRRKGAVARVFLYEEKNGPFIVNGKPYEESFRGAFFGSPHLEPFRVTNTLGLYKVNAKISGSGKKSQMEAITLGVSRSLEKVDKENFRPLLKKRGFLTRDSRIRERRKVGTGGRARRQKQSPKR